MGRSICFETSGRSGVETETLNAVVGLLTTDSGMVMTDVRLLEKQGGKSGHWVGA